MSSSCERRNARASASPSTSSSEPTAARSSDRATAYDFELTFAHARGAKSYEVSRSELREAVGSLEDVEGLALAREFLRSQEEDIAA